MNKNTTKTKFKYKPQRKVTLTTFFQSLYLTLGNFLKNDLLSYASSCSFGFLFSFIPVVMLILVVLLRILHASPDTVMKFLATHEIFAKTINIEKTAEAILNIKTISTFEIVTGIAIIMMARRFFATTMNSLKCIFKQETKRKAGLTQLFIFLGEAILVIIMAILISALLTFRTVLTMPVFESVRQHFPRLLGSFSESLAYTVPIFIVFFTVLIFYIEGSGTKPPFGMAFVSATGCTFAFWAFQKLMKLFINVNRYNLVYGVLSNVIVLLLEVWFFFIIFLFFGQFLFVNQFFDTLILSELYLLPDRDDVRLGATFKRILFIRPDALLVDQNNVIKCKKDSTIYIENEPGTDVFYIASGTVEISRVNNISYLDKGQFFGEQACLLNEIRIDTAKAHTDVEIVRISEETFFDIIQKNPDVNRKALSQISNYFSKFYGRSDDYSI